jgi:hypothetical protein
VTAYDQAMAELVKRIADAEAKLEELAETRVFAVDREYDREARWHATRDAMLPYCADLAHDAHLSREQVADEALARAAVFANRAHGPLDRVGK